VEISLSGFVGDLPSLVGDDGTKRSVVDDYLEWVRRAHAEGFSRIWTPQLPWEPDLITMLAVAFHEVPDIEVGSAVLPIQVAHPTLTAQRALVLSLISGGRFTLGLGVNHPGMSERFWGIPWEKPLRRMKDYLDAVLPLLSEEAITVGGRLRTGAPTPQVYIAAMGPQMLRLAARRTAGTITWMTGPRTQADHIGPTLREAAAAAGRPEGAVKVIAILPISVTDEVDRTREKAAEAFAIYSTLPSYRTMLEREGFAGPQDAALIGDEATVLDLINEFRSAGVDEFVGLPFGDSDEDLARSRSLLRQASFGAHARCPQ
jgi:5,10-methylenetetrahydromethanopterin reductase